MANKKIELIVAASELLFREGLVALLRQRRDIQVIAMAGNGEEVIKLCENHCPDVLLISGTMPKKDTIEVVKEVKRTCLDTAILVIADSWHRYTVSSFTDVGASGLIMKNISSTELVDVIRVVHAGHTVVGKDGEHIPQAAGPVEIMITRLLHPREKEVLRLASSGMTNKQIAVTLSISEHTVSTHFFNIYRKLGVSTRLEATLVALQEGLYNTSELIAGSATNK